MDTTWGEGERTDPSGRAKTRPGQDKRGNSPDWPCNLFVVLSFPRFVVDWSFPRFIETLILMLVFDFDRRREKTGKSQSASVVIRHRCSSILAAEGLAGTAWLGRLQGTNCQVPSAANFNFRSHPKAQRLTTGRHLLVWATFAGVCRFLLGFDGKDPHVIHSIHASN